MNFIRKIIQSPSKDDALFYNEIKEVLGFTPKDISLYKNAFLHSSVKQLDDFGNTMSYERLEFLGDATLGAVIASYLYKKVPSGNEGYLTQMRSKIVSREHLNELGMDLNLIQFVNSAIPKENLSDNVHGNIFEALIGAIYLDRGYNYCKKFVYHRVIVPYIDIKRLEGKITSYKSLVIEWCQKNKKKFEFETYEDTGNDVAKHFSVRLHIDNKVVAKARATSKKKAEEKASQRAFYVLQDKIDLGSTTT